MEVQGSLLVSSITHSTISKWCARTHDTVLCLSALLIYQIINTPNCVIDFNKDAHQTLSLGQTSETGQSKSFKLRN